MARRRLRRGRLLMSELPVSTPTCGCGDAHGAEPELDARSLPHAVRHAAILGAVDGLPPGGAFVLIAPHDPVPLLAQLRKREGAAVSVEYLQSGPESWRL